MRRFRLLSALAAFLTLSLMEPRVLTAQSLQIRAVCPSADAEDYFFRTGALNPDSARGDQLRQKWFSRSLASMNEPSLSCGSSGGVVYRFLWLRTFHHPIAVRITRQSELVELEATELSGAGGYDPGQTLHHTSKHLLLEDWKRLDSALAENDFWNMNARSDWMSTGMDGAEWIVEGRKGDAYRVVQRWSPEPGPYRDLGLLFLALADIQVPAAILY